MERFELLRRDMFIRVAGFFTSHPSYEVSSPRLAQALTDFRSHLTTLEDMSVLQSRDTTGSTAHKMSLLQKLLEEIIVLREAVRIYLYDHPQEALKGRFGFSKYELEALPDMTILDTADDMLDAAQPILNDLSPLGYDGQRFTALQNLLQEARNAIPSQFAAKSGSAESTRRIKDLIREMMALLKNIVDPTMKVIASREDLADYLAIRKTHKPGFRSEETPVKTE